MLTRESLTFDAAAFQCLEYDGHLLHVTDVSLAKNMQQILVDNQVSKSLFLTSCKSCQQITSEVWVGGRALRDEERPTDAEDFSAFAWVTGRASEDGEWSPPSM